MLDSSLVQQRVFIIGEGSIFDEGVMQMLTHGTNFLVSRAVYSDDLPILNIIKQDRPDVVLICESASLDTARILDEISLLPMAIGVRTIVMRLSHKVIDVYANPGFVEQRMPRRILIETEAEFINVVGRKNKGT